MNLALIVTFLGLVISKKNAETKIYLIQTGDNERFLIKTKEMRNGRKLIAPDYEDELLISDEGKVYRKREGQEGMDEKDNKFLDFLGSLASTALQSAGDAAVGNINGKIAGRHVSGV